MQLPARPHGRGGGAPGRGARARAAAPRAGDGEGRRRRGGRVAARQRLSHRARGPGRGGGLPQRAAPARRQGRRPGGLRGGGAGARGTGRGDGGAPGGLPGRLPERAAAGARGAHALCGRRARGAGAFRRRQRARRRLPLGGGDQPARALHARPGPGAGARRPDGRHTAPRPGGRLSAHGRAHARHVPGGDHALGEKTALRRAEARASHPRPLGGLVRRGTARGLVALRPRTALTPARGGLSGGQRGPHRRRLRRRGRVRAQPDGGGARPAAGIRPGEGVYGRGGAPLLAPAADTAHGARRVRRGGGAHGLRHLRPVDAGGLRPRSGRAAGRIPLCRPRLRRARRFRPAGRPAGGGNGGDAGGRAAHRRRPRRLRRAERKIRRRLPPPLPPAVIFRARRPLAAARAQARGHHGPGRADAGPGERAGSRQRRHIAHPRGGVYPGAGCGHAIAAGRGGGAHRRHAAPAQPRRGGKWPRGARPRAHTPAHGHGAAERGGHALCARFRPRGRHGPL